MKNNKYYLAAITGSVVFFLLGGLIYGLFLESYMNSHSGLTADLHGQVFKAEEQMVWWALIASNVASGFLLATILMWGNFNTAAGGAKASAIVGFLLVSAYDLGFYAFTNLFVMESLVVDILATTLMMSVTGAVIAMILGKGVSTE